MVSSRSDTFSLGKTIAPARFVIFFLVFIGGTIAYDHWVEPRRWLEAVAMGFDLGACLFLASLVNLLFASNPETIRRHARQNDANRILVLAITTVLTIVVLAAISGELGDAKSGDGLAMAKLIGTLSLAWLFANSIYALHYAHEYYTADPSGSGDLAGIDFPKTGEPDYSDFGYFAFTLGMTFQTSDCDITRRSIRRVALLHSLAAFVFNMGVIAFTINAIGGALG